MLQKNTYNSATLIGAAGLLIWAASGVLASFVKTIPTFETLSITYLLSMILSFVKIIRENTWKKLAQQPCLLWAVGLICVYGNDLFYFLAVKHGPIVQIELINYLWPIFVMLFVYFVPGEKFHVKSLLAALVGFSGIYLVLFQKGLLGLHARAIYGYLFALTETLLWSTYILFCRHYKEAPSSMLGFYCSLGFLLSMIAHYSYEKTIIPNYYQALLLLIIGFGSHGFAYIFWDKGIKKGNFKLLCVGSYTSPIISMILLYAFGLAHLTPTVFVACLLVTLSGFLASTGSDQTIKKNSHGH